MDACNSLEGMVSINWVLDKNPCYVSTSVTYVRVQGDVLCNIPLSAKRQRCKLKICSTSKSSPLSTNDHFRTIGGAGQKSLLCID